jgi:hypothetical protein
MLEARAPLTSVEAVVDAGHRSAHRIPSVAIVGPELVWGDDCLRTADVGGGGRNRVDWSGQEPRRETGEGSA